MFARSCKRGFTLKKTGRHVGRLIWPLNLKPEIEFFDQNELTSFKWKLDERNKCYSASSALQCYLSNESSSSWPRSQAMYSSEASLSREHHDRSSTRSWRRFSAITSTPSSVTLLQPDRLSSVSDGSVRTTFRMPWFVISQHECKRNVLSGRTVVVATPTPGPAQTVAGVHGPANRASAASVTWYAWRLSSRSAGRSWAMAATVSSATLIQSLMLSWTMRGRDRAVHSPASVSSLQPLRSRLTTLDISSSSRSSPRSEMLEQRTDRSTMCADACGINESSVSMSESTTATSLRESKPLCSIERKYRRRASSTSSWRQ